IILLSLTTVYTVSIIGPEHVSPFFVGFYEGGTGISTSLTSEQAGYLLGTMLFPLVSIGLVFTLIRKRTKRIYSACLIVLGITIISALQKGALPIFPIIIMALLLSKEIRSQLTEVRS
ncbi:MAG: hypothetical protein RLY57_649, partial [Candidatus Parcubacteria bacterium]